ncbi:MAG: L,D-transpeptidase family protein [Nitrosomonadales bacterium]|nr:L,D-transpeptidase family protein [Nitrosomonadales bacterium]
MLYRVLVSSLLCALLAGVACAAPDSHNTEAQLAKSLQAIKNNRLDIALNEVDNLLRVNPNFKLAYLVKGDLLMARAGAINNFGSAANAPRDMIEDLRDEARVRLQRVQAHLSGKLSPRYLWKLDTQQKYAIVVDTSRSTLYVYENVKGEPRYVADFYITIGKLGTEKFSEGDKRTPIGVYFVKAELPKSELADMYGSGAYPLSYPNEWDRKNGRTGKGIWLHGTPSDTYSRPPRASDGCVVLANDDLDKLAPYLQIGVTPVIITNRIDWVSGQDRIERDALLQGVEQWRKDWSSLDTGTYLKHYSRNFSSDSMGFTAWAKQKQLVNSGKSWIKVNISNVSVFTYPEQPNMAVVNFEQDYNSSNLSNRMKKRQYWIKQNNRWQIVYEGAA